MILPSNGACQRLGELVVNTTWDSETRRGAITLLGEMYANDTDWGRQATVKQWILNILMLLSSRSSSEIQCKCERLHAISNAFFICLPRFSQESNSPLQSDHWTTQLQTRYSKSCDRMETPRNRHFIKHVKRKDQAHIHSKLSCQRLGIRPYWIVFRRSLTSKVTSVN